jgi:hypothetical protein
MGKKEELIITLLQLTCDLKLNVIDYKLKIYAFLLPTMDEEERCQQKWVRII